MNHYIKIFSNKPKEDINDIVETMGYRNIAPAWSRNNGFTHFMVKLFSMFRILSRLKRNDILLIQYPMKKFYTPACLCAHIKGAKVVTLIHDLGSFRRKKLTPQHENRRLNRSDFIILHNESMKAFVEKNGCKSPLYCLEIFDYLSPRKHADYASPHSPWKVVYAGGLGYVRNPFLYELDSHISGWELDLYGRRFDSSRATGWNNMHFRGQLPSDDFISTVKADFGLVWDGNSLTECSGAWGEYLMFNNPHKTSFYLRAGIPIIIWKRAALAPFVERNGVGITVDTLDEINDVLALMKPEEYARIRRNAEMMGEKIANGFFTRKALNEAERVLGNK